MKCVMKHLGWLIGAALPLLPLPASAGASAWHRAEGADIRLLTMAEPDADGILRGAIEIALKPGWKTYWRDPGDSGVPPSIDISKSPGIVSAEISYPAPRRVDDGYSVWAGYTEPVSLPVTFRLASHDAANHVVAGIFLGVCEKICVPVQAHFEIDPSGAADAANEAVVTAAHDAAPRPADAAHGVRFVGIEGGKLLVSAAAAPGEDVIDLFVAGTDAYGLGVPKRADSKDGVAFRIALSPWTDSRPLPPLYFTLVTSAGAYDGFLELDY